MQNHYHDDDPGWGKQILSQLNADRIINAIKADLTKKGFQENAADPDLKVNPITELMDKKEVTANSNYYGGPCRPADCGSAASSMEVLCRKIG